MSDALILGILGALGVASIVATVFAAYWLDRLGAALLDRWHKQ